MKTLKDLRDKCHWCQVYDDDIRDAAREWIKKVEYFETYKQPPYPKELCHKDGSIDYSVAKQWQKENKDVLYENVINSLPKLFGSNEFIFDDEYNHDYILMGVLKDWIKHFFNLEEDD